MSEPTPHGQGGSPNVVVVDGAGDRYEVVGYQATFTLKRKSDGLVIPNVSSVQLRDLGWEWDGRTLKAVGA